jgi:1-acyl-sn-glycerol-3-phosphate acyltransferase
MSRQEANVPDLPSAGQIDRLAGLLGPLERVVRPKVYGAEHLPADGSLLVGNHTICGFLGLPFMMAEIWKRRRLPVRGLGEHAHYGIPFWRDALTACGMVRGTCENVRTLMRERQTILVFPGGAREVNKRKGEKYQLIWKERLGFARLAIEFGYPIVPFAAVGAEEMLDVVIDDTNPAYRPLARAFEKLTNWPAQPIVRGVGPMPLPRPERLYFWFGEPIDTTGFDGRSDDDDAARELGDEVKRAVAQGIAFLHDERDRDPHRSLARRLRARASDS